MHLTESVFDTIGYAYQHAKPFNDLPCILIVDTAIQKETAEIRKATSMQDWLTDFVSVSCLSPFVFELDDLCNRADWIENIEKCGRDSLIWTPEKHAMKMRKFVMDYKIF